jgi:hypothetical protein
MECNDINAKDNTPLSGRKNCMIENPYVFLPSGRILVNQDLFEGKNDESKMRGCDPFPSPPGNGLDADAVSGRHAAHF